MNIEVPSCLLADLAIAASSEGRAAASNDVPTRAGFDRAGLRASWLLRKHCRETPAEPVPEPPQDPAEIGWLITKLQQLQAEGVTHVLGYNSMGRVDEVRGIEESRSVYDDGARLAVLLQVREDGPRFVR